MAILELQEVSVFYRKICAVRRLSFQVQEGEIFALIGANGAGKTTTLRTISGLLSPATGRIVVGGEDLTRRKAHQRVARGLAHVPEGRGIFADMTVAENLEMGFQRRYSGARRRQERARIFALFPRLAERQKQRGGTLSGGEQQMLAIARALVSHPRILLLDEPSMGLAPQMVSRVFELLAEVHRADTTIVLVEQNARQALALAQNALVLERGEAILSGTGKELAENAQVQRSYLGA